MQFLELTEQRERTVDVLAGARTGVQQGAAQLGVTGVRVRDYHFVARVIGIGEVQSTILNTAVPST